VSAICLAGKRIVVTAGWPREDIDGVRHYANHSRPESQGFAAAAWFAAQGADVTIIGPQNSFYLPPAGCRIIHQDEKGHPIMSGRDLMQAAGQYADNNSCDVVFLYACIASIRPVERAAQKLKVKDGNAGSVTMDVAGNVDVERLANTWRTPALGYNQWQEKFQTRVCPDWAGKGASDFENDKIAPCPTTVLRADLAIAPSGTLPDLSGKKVIVTSGPTEELMTTTGDLITNSSTGQQGAEIANAFAQSGALVSLITGPARFPPPPRPNIRALPAPSALSMFEACEAELPADVFVGVAAVADFGCKKPFRLRLEEAARLKIKLDQNPDILGTMGHHSRLRPAVVVGFAAETDAENIIAYAKGKLGKKNADLICANVVGRSLKHDQNETQLVFVTPVAKPQHLPVMSKSEAARTIVQEAAARITKSAS
jgi:phosphopantothenoylcysteine synthetase/decarboxylase